MPSSIKKLGVASLTALLLAAVFVQWIIPNFTARRLEQLVFENCLTCKLTIGSLRFSLAHPGRLDFAQIHFTNGEPGAVELDVQVPALQVRMAWWPLFANRIELLKVELFKPEVKITYGIKRPLIAAFTLQDGLKFAFGVFSATVHNGEFRYTRRLVNSAAPLKLHHIDLTVVDLGTLPDFAGKQVKSHASAQIEQSGSLEADLASSGPQQALNLDAKIALSDQNLADLTQFFKPLSGVSLDGTLVRGRVHLALHGPHLSAQVRADYRDFRVQAAHSHVQGENAAFFSALALNLKSSRRDPAGLAAVKPTELERRRGEMLSDFLLRGVVQEGERGQRY